MDYMKTMLLIRRKPDGRVGSLNVARIETGMKLRSDN
jgi:hypothetical protein